MKLVRKIEMLRERRAEDRDPIDAGAQVPGLRRLEMWRPLPRRGNFMIMFMAAGRSRRSLSNSRPTVSLER